MMKFSASDLTPRESTIQFLKFFARTYVFMELPDQEGQGFAVN